MDKNWLKMWIAIYFGTGLMAIFSLVMIIKGTFEYILPMTECFFFCWVIYHFKLKGEFKKMRKEYEQAGSLRKVVGKWKEKEKEEVK